MTQRYSNVSLEVVSEGIMDEYSVPGEPDVRYVTYRKTIEYDPQTTRDIDKRFNYSLDSFKGKRVLLIGAGTLGNEFAKDLAFSGVNDITIVDMDDYEYYNLPRSTMIRQEDVGKKKSLALAKRVAEASPFDITVTGIATDISRLGFGFIEQFDMIMSPVDSWSIRAYASRAAHVLGIDHISSGTSVLGFGDATMMAATVTAEPRGCAPCYECMVKGNLNDQKAKLSCLSIKPETQAQVLAFSSVAAGFATQAGIGIMTGKYRIGAGTGKEAVSYQIREFMKVNDEDGNTLTTTRSRPNENCTFHSELKDVETTDIAEITIGRDSSIRDIWDMLNQVFGTEGSYVIDFHWSALYYMIYPEGATRDENRTPPINSLPVDDRDDEEIDSYTLHRLPPDHVYMVTECSSLDERKRMVRIRVH